MNKKNNGQKKTRPYKGAGFKEILYI